jgi:hypothetical protein
MKLNMHYETLLNSRSVDASSQEFAPDTGAAASLDRLSSTLRALLRSMGEKQPTPLVNQLQDGPSSEDHDAPTGTSTPESTISPAEGEQSGQDSEEDIDVDADLLGMNDWAYAREAEISRLEAENEALRKELGIDAQTAQERGWIADEEDSSRRISMIITASHSFTRGSYGGGSRGPSGGPGASPDFPSVGGAGLSQPPPVPPPSRMAQAAWGSVRPSTGTPGLLVTNAPPSIAPPQPSIGGMFTGLPNTGPNHQPQSMQPQPPPPLQQQPSQPPAAPNSNLSSVPPSVRGLQTRRPAMFGQRGGARGGGPSTGGYWTPPASTDVRPWPGLQPGQGGAGLDLR